MESDTDANNSYESSYCGVEVLWGLEASETVGLTEQQKEGVFVMLLAYKPLCKKAVVCIFCYHIYFQIIPFRA